MNVIIYLVRVPEKLPFRQCLTLQYIPDFEGDALIICLPRRAKVIAEKRRKNVIIT